MHHRVTLFQARDHLAVPVERELGMQAAHNMKFGHGFRISPACRFPNLFKRHGVAVRIFRFLSKGASRQLATQTSVGLICRLTLKYVTLPCIRSRTRLAIKPRARMSELRYMATQSSKLRRSPASTFLQIGRSRGSSIT